MNCLEPAESQAKPVTQAMKDLTYPRKEIPFLQVGDEFSEKSLCFINFLMKTKSKSFLE